MDSMYTITGTFMGVHLPEEIDHHVSEQLCAQIDRLVQKKYIRHLVFDFEKTTFMDSSGIGMLIGRCKMMQFLCGEVMAVNVGERMERILKMAGMDRIMEIEGKTECSKMK